MYEKSLLNLILNLLNVTNATTLDFYVSVTLPELNAPLDDRHTLEQFYT